MAQSVLQIVVKLKDQASRELAKVDKQLDNVGNAAKKSGLNIESFSKGFLAIGTAAAGIATTVGLAFRDIVNDTVEYGKAVDDVSRALGTSTEEASKLIQIADDLRIDQDKLKMSFRFALKEGINPSIGGLKELAEEYQQLPNSTAKAQFAMEKFGARSGLEMQKVLELTSEQIDEMAKSAEEAGLVLDREAVEATKKFWREVDTLNDSLEGLKITVGTGVIPTLIKMFDVLNEKVKFEIGFAKVASEIEDIRGQFDEDIFGAFSQDAVDVNDELNRITRDFVSGQIDETEAMKRAGLVRKKYNLLVDDSAILVKELAGRTRELTDETETEIQVFDDLTAYQNEISMGYQRMGMTADEAKQAAIDMTVATGEAARELLKAREELEKARTVRFFDVDMGFGDTAADALKALDFRDLGGDAGASLVEAIKQAIVTHPAERETWEKYLEQVYVAAQGIQITLGEIDTEEAQANIEEDLGKSGEEAKALIDAELAKPLDMAAFQQNLENQFKALEDRRNALIGAGELEPNKLEITADPGDAAKGRLDAISLQLYNLTKAPWVIEVQVKQTGGVNGLPVPGGQHGLDMVVPPGFPNDSYLVAATSGERVQIGRGGGSGRNVVINQHFYNEGSAALGLAMVDEYSGRRLDASMGG